MASVISGEEEPVTETEVSAVDDLPSTQGLQKRAENVQLEQEDDHFSHGGLSPGSVGSEHTEQEKKERLRVIQVKNELGQFEYFNVFFYFYCLKFELILAFEYILCIQYETCSCL